MNYKNDYSSLKYIIHNTEKILEDYNDTRNKEEKQKIVNEKIAKELHKHNAIFHYSNSGTRPPIYSKIYVFDRENDNLILESGMYGEANEILFKTIDQNSLNEIKAIIHSNRWLLEIKEDDTAGPMMTDGTVQGLFFSDDGLNNYFTMNNFGFQSTFSDAEKNREFETIVNKILSILTN